MIYPLFKTTLFHPLGKFNFRSNPFQQHFMATLLTERATKCSLQSPPPFRKPLPWQRHQNRIVKTLYSSLFPFSYQTDSFLWHFLQLFQKIREIMCLWHFSCFHFAFYLNVLFYRIEACKTNHGFWIRRRIDPKCWWVSTVFRAWSILWVCMSIERYPHLTSSRYFLMIFSKH